MAKTSAVWGIDIGQCALKALRCLPGDRRDRMVVDNFDYVEYPKILSQPEADPETLVREALQDFLSRHNLAGERVAISVSGQSGLARFIKLPPVESKMIPNIVKYEARQQIPFALEDVVWDYQQMAGGSVEEGYALETEVGLFAMKRDQVYRALEPFTNRGIGVDFVQLTPLAVYNFVVFDQLKDLPAADEYDPEDPPPSLVVISMGVDSTDLVVTNGFRVWQRSIPIGGAHFTRALTKELRLTYARAEKLKRNATKAENPKAVFQAMRPVFSDLVTEIQRSIGYFNGIDRHAKIEKGILLGNPLKLPGLQRYLSDHLKITVRAIENFRGLTGETLTSDKKFRRNLPAFCVCYGLCLQGLGKSRISTNLLPQEIVTLRLVREKKPWAVAAAAALLVGCAVSYAGHYRQWYSADVENRDDLKSVITQADGVKRMSASMQQEYEQAKTQFQTITTIGDSLISNVEGRLFWLELLKAIHAALPHDPPDQKPEKIADRQELHIETLDCEKFDDLASWYQPVAESYQRDFKWVQKAETPPEAPADAPASATPDVPAAAPAIPTAPPSDAPPAEDPGPTGPGWVIELAGYHYHNENMEDQGAEFVRRTLIKNLHNMTVPLPDGKGGEIVDVPISDLGIAYPVIVQQSPIGPPEQLVDESPTVQRSARSAVAARDERTARSPQATVEPPSQTVRRFDFIVQFVWKPTPESARRELARQRQAEAAATVAAVERGRGD